MGSLEQALSLTPRDASLRSKIGRALVTTHDYRRAYEYYENALRLDGSRVELRLELADLYIRLRMIRADPPAAPKLSACPPAACVPAVA